MIDQITWKYDSTMSPFVSGTTVSLRSVGFTRVGDRDETHPHMEAIKVQTIETPSYMHSDDDCPLCDFTHRYTTCPYFVDGAFWIGFAGPFDNAEDAAKYKSVAHPA